MKSSNLIFIIEGDKTSVKSNGEVISSFEYDYNWNRNIVSVTNKHGNTPKYDYDKENRLTSAEYPSGMTMEFKYDQDII